MTPPPLSEDEFRLLAYIRSYADAREQSLDPSWIWEQLELPVDRFQLAARGLAGRGLAEFFEWRPDDPTLARLVPPAFGDGPMAMNIRLTEKGWNYLIARDVV